MAAGGTPQVVNLDMAVAKTIRTYHAAAAETQGGMRSFVDYLAGMANVSIPELPGGYGVASNTGAALVWSSPYRGDRIGVPTSSNLAIRRMEAQLNIPGGALRRAFNLQGFMERDLVNSETLLSLRGAGLAALGSEGSQDRL